MDDKEKKGPSYRWAAFGHWLNVAFLGAGAVAGATIDPTIWAALVPAELALLWVLPDLPPFRLAVDKQYKRRSMLAERAFYLDQLWGLSPREPKGWGDRVLSALVQQEKDDYDDRVVMRGAEFQKYLEIRGIVSKLREMSALPDSRIRERDVLRFEHVMNAYLGLLVATKTLAAVCNSTDGETLRSELAILAQQLEGAEPSLRSVLLERQRLLRTQLDRLPKLTATL